MDKLQNGSTGDDVRVLQYLLGRNPSGKYGPNLAAAVKKYQKGAGLTTVGRVGPRTWAALAEGAPALTQESTGNYVGAVQVFLGVEDTGLYDDATIEAVTGFERRAGLTATGEVDAATWRAMLVGVEAEEDGEAAGARQPVDYKQTDKRWKNVMYSANSNKKQTIGTSGCRPTAMADVIATWCDPSVTPKELAAVAVQKKYRTRNSGTTYGFFGYVAKHYGLRCKQTSSTKRAVEALEGGALVIANMGPGYWTKGGHYICCWKADETYIYANDPASGKRKRAAIARFNKERKMYFIITK